MAVDRVLIRLIVGATKARGPELIPDDLDDLGRLDGCSIVDAFRQFVLAHQSVVNACQELRATDTNRAIFEEGQFPGPIITFDWPTLLTADELAEEFVRRIAYFIDDPAPRASPEQQQAARALASRWAALIKLLQDRALVASGTYHLTGAASEIDKLMWRRRNVAIDMQNGDLVEYIDNKKVVLWRGLSVSLGTEPGRKIAALPERALSRLQHGPALTPAKASVEAAVKALWPDGIPSELPKQVRDTRINEWLKVKALPQVSTKTIQRFLKSIGQ